MTNEEIKKLVEDNGITIVGEAMFKFAELITEAEQARCIDILERLQERAGDSHNYYTYAVRVLKGET